MTSIDALPINAHSPAEHVPAPAPSPASAVAAAPSLPATDSDGEQLLGTLDRERHSKKWTDAEDVQLIDAIKAHTVKNSIQWNLIRDHVFPSRTIRGIQLRWYAKVRVKLAALGLEPALTGKQPQASRTSGQSRLPDDALVMDDLNGLSNAHYSSDSSLAHTLNGGQYHSELPSPPPHAVFVPPPRLLYPSPPMIQLDYAVVDTIPGAPPTHDPTLTWTATDDARFVHTVRQFLTPTGGVALVVWSSPAMKLVFPGRSSNSLSSRWYKIRNREHITVADAELEAANHEAFVESVHLAAKRADVCINLQPNEPLPPYLVTPLIIDGQSAPSTDSDNPRSSKRQRIDDGALTEKDVALLPAFLHDLVPWSGAEDSVLSSSVADNLRSARTIDWPELACQSITHRSVTDLIRRWHTLLASLVADTLADDRDMPHPHSVDAFTANEDWTLLQCASRSLRMIGEIDWDRFHFDALRDRPYQQLERRWRELVLAMIDAQPLMPLTEARAALASQSRLFPVWNDREDWKLKHAIVREEDPMIANGIDWLPLVRDTFPTRSLEDIKYRWKCLLLEWLNQQSPRAQPLPSPSAPLPSSSSPSSESAAMATQPAPSPSSIQSATHSPLPYALNRWTHADDERLAQLLVASAGKGQKMSWSQFRRENFPHHASDWIRSRYYDYIKPKLTAMNPSLVTNTGIQEVDESGDGGGVEGEDDKKGEEMSRAAWTDDEDSMLIDAVMRTRRPSGRIRWSGITSLFPNRSSHAVVARWRDRFEPTFRKEEAETIADMEASGIAVKPKQIAAVISRAQPPAPASSHSYIRSNYAHTNTSTAINTPTGQQRLPFPMPDRTGISGPKPKPPLDPESLRPFTAEEDALLFRAVHQFRNHKGQINWSGFVPKLFPHRNYTQLNNRWHREVKPKMTHGDYQRLYAELDVIRMEEERAKHPKGVGNGGTMSDNGSNAIPALAVVSRNGISVDGGSVDAVQMALLPSPADLATKSRQPAAGAGSDIMDVNMSELVPRES